MFTLNFEASKIFLSFFLVPGERSLCRPHVFFAVTASIFLLRLSMSRCKIRTIDRFSVESTKNKLNLSWWILIRNTISRIFAFNRFEFDVTISSSPPSSILIKNEPRHEKTNVLHMQKQRRRSASRSPQN